MDKKGANFQIFYMQHPPGKASCYIKWNTQNQWTAFIGTGGKQVLHYKDRYIIIRWS